jgi:hypothetical protein
VFPRFITASPLLRRGPFDHADYLFELKHDGLRALAYIDGEGTRLVSRRGNVYRRFPQLCGAIAKAVTCEAVLDGENRLPGSRGVGCSFTNYSGDAATWRFTFSMCCIWMGAWLAPVPFVISAASHSLISDLRLRRETVWDHKRS